VAIFFEHWGSKIEEKDRSLLTKTCAGYAWEADMLGCKLVDSLIDAKFKLLLDQGELLDNLRWSGGL